MYIAFWMIHAKVAGCTCPSACLAGTKQNQQQTKWLNICAFQLLRTDLFPCLQGFFFHVSMENLLRRICQEGIADRDAET